MLALPTANHSIVNDFAQSIQPWSRERVPLPRSLRYALWALIPVELPWAAWLVAIVSGVSPCDGRICTVATLNHAAVLLACAAICIVGIALLVPFTRGLSECNGREVVGLAIASAAGGVALLGVGALLVAAAIVLVLLATFVLNLHRDV